MYSSRTLKDFRSSARGKAVAEGRLAPRDCTKEERVNCIGECEWVKDPWNPFSAGSCQFKETKSMIYDSYCSDFSDPADLIKILVKAKATGRKSYRKKLSKMTKRELCNELDSYLESLTDSTGGFDESNFLSWGITREDFTRALGYALDAYPVRNIIGTIKYIAGYFKRNKWIRVTAYAVAIVIVLYFVVPQKHIDNINEIVDGYYNAAINYFVPPTLPTEVKPWDRTFSYEETWYKRDGIKRGLEAFKEKWNETLETLQSNDFGKYFGSEDRIVDHIEGRSINMRPIDLSNETAGFFMRNHSPSAMYNYQDMFTVSSTNFVTFDEETRNSIHHIIDKQNLIDAYKSFARRYGDDYSTFAPVIRGDSWQIMLPSVARVDANSPFLAGITNVETYPVRYYTLPSGVDMYTGVKTVLETFFEIAKSRRNPIFVMDASYTRDELRYIEGILAIVYTMM